MTNREAYETAKRMLVSGGIEDGAFEARQLFYFATGLSASDMLVKYAEQIPLDAFDLLIKSCSERLSSTPLQYIIGSWDFHSVTVKVEKGVLIPRADTEVLVDEAINFLKEKDRCRVIDLCTGTGCVITAVAKNCGESHEYLALDKYPTPLALAKHNASANEVQVQVIEGDVLECKGADKKYDLILCNPPYIRSEVIENLQPEVQKEPREALDGGEDGLIFYRALCDRWLSYLNYGGMLAVEIGYDQAEEVEGLFKAAGLKSIKTIRDAAGNDRVVSAIKEGI